jgi:diacylglycerol kinase (ATP)
MRVTLIHNECAGDEEQPSAQQLRDMLRSAGHDVSYRSARGDDWTAALSEPVDLIAVAGGDGTIGRVAQRMAGSSIALAVLPMGTANNISRTLRIADTPLERLISSWDRARIRKLDIGIARGPWGCRRFIEGLGVGVFAWTMPEADASVTLASLANADSKIAYALQMLKDRLAHSAPITLTATLDGDELSGDYVLFEAMSTQYIGPNLYLAPHGDPGDGYLDVVMVTEAERERLIDYLSSWQNGELRRPELPTRRGRHLAMQWTGFHVHIDDDIWPEDGATPLAAPAPIDVTLEAQALSVLVPE